MLYLDCDRLLSLLSCFSCLPSSLGSNLRENIHLKGQIQKPGAKKVFKLTAAVAPFLRLNVLGTKCMEENRLR